MPKAALNPAEKAAEAATQTLFATIKQNKSFLLEAGAGAGKTHSLVRTLRYIIEDQGKNLLRRNQKIACITYTNVAKEEIESRTDRNPLVHCDTIHGFCWSIIKDFQPQLRLEIAKIEKWKEPLEEVGGIGARSIEYTLGHSKVHPDRVSLHHNDVLALFIALMNYEKFRKLWISHYPILLIDEYQDTDAGVAESLKVHFLGKEISPLIGFFGDHWQMIYRDVCGKIEHPALTVIGKKANFRSAKAIVDVLNRMRTELPQEVTDPEAEGFVTVYHTNEWSGHRRTEPNWRGELPAEIAHSCLEALKQDLRVQGWDFSSSKATKILMLTHNVLARELGYPSLPAVFQYADSFIRKEDPHILFFVDTVEPVCEAFQKKRFGEMFSVLGTEAILIRSLADKKKFAEVIEQLIKLRTTGTVGEVSDYLRKAKIPALPDTVERRERELKKLGNAPDFTENPGLESLHKLRSVPYKEIIALDSFLDERTPFSTKHGVKGEEYENVLVVVGRGGWNLYNFNQMLELGADPQKIPADRMGAFERSRNLFYVCCSRPKKRLALLFTQELSGKALETLGKWFGKESMISIHFELA